MKSVLAFLAACLVVSLSSAHAAIKVGDEAKLSYQTVDGKSVDVSRMHGKILVIDFWATWCGPCMAEAPHMVSLNQKYGSKGLQILGVSLDNDKEAMLSVSKAKGFTWPQYFDGQGWGNALWKQWGENGIPFTVLVDANGKVAYVGHPAGGLDVAIEKTFKDTPPFLVDPAIVSAAMQVLGQVEEKIAQKDMRGAMKLMAKVPSAAHADEKFAARSGDVQKELEKAGESLLSDATAQVAAANYPDAIKGLRDLSEGMSGLPVGAKAKGQLAVLLAKPEVKAALAKIEKDAKDSERNAKANEALAVAQKLQAAKKDEMAYGHFKEIAATFVGTDAAGIAAGQVKMYDQQHPEFARNVKDSAIGAKARAALSVANSYLESGSTEAAKAKFRSVIESFPGTPYAETAKKELEKLGG